MSKKKRKYKRNTPPEVYGYDPKRDERMVSLYREGNTLQEIGDKYEVSRERVRQVLYRSLKKKIKKQLQEGRLINTEGKSIRQLVKEEVKKMADNRMRKRVLKKLKEAEELGVVPEKYTSRMEFAKKIGFSLSTIKRYAPEVIHKIRENIPMGYGGKKWSRHYLRCRGCGTTSKPHRSHGYCYDCYVQSDHFKALQQSSRLRNMDRWKPRINAYLKEYYDKKSFGGNRDTALKRDNNKCVNCGVTAEEHQKRFEERIRVVHLGDVKNNNLSNLATMCRKCSLRHIRSKRS